MAGQADDVNPLATMEVAGSSFTLLAEIEQGNVPLPILMEFNDWQQWRRDFGRRPRMVADGRSTTPQFEATLWRATMLHFH